MKTRQVRYIIGLLLAMVLSGQAQTAPTITKQTTSQVATLTGDPMFTQITTGPIVTAAGGWTASWVDYDGDGNLDLIIAPRGDVLARVSVFHNEGGGTFSKVTNNAIAQTAVKATGPVWGDYDNDGKVDLFVPNAEMMNDMLFHNDGNGSFTRITTGHPVIDGDYSNASVWGDYDRDGFLDLFVPTVGCPILYRSNGDGTFRKMTLAEMGPIISCLGSDYAVWADVDNDGWPELYRNVTADSSVPNWSMTNQVYHLDSQGKFYLMDIGAMKKGTEGYSGITWADYDNDGLLDALVGAERGSFGLYRNLGGQGFTDVAANAFPAAPPNFYTATAVDYDNDGWQDVVAYTFDTTKAPAFFRNNGDGTFTSQDVGGPSSAVGGFLSWGDYNNDGFLDALVIYGPGIRNSLFRHNGNTNHWLKVKLDGRASNRSGIGAKVRVNATIGGRTFWQMREISGQGVSYDNGLIAHFGLGDATSVTTLRIEWPSGIVQDLQNVATNQFLTVVESQSYGGAPPRFGAVTNGAGGLQLSLIEPVAGARYVLEASSDLVSWTKLMARTSAGGTSQFTDTRTTNYGNRFYRLQVP